MFLLQKVKYKFIFCFNFFKTWIFWKVKAKCVQFENAVNVQSASNYQPPSECYRFNSGSGFSDGFSIDYNTVVWNWAGDKRTEYFGSKTEFDCCSGCVENCYMWTYEKPSKRWFQWNLSDQVIAFYDDSPFNESFEKAELKITEDEYKNRAKYSADFISAKLSCLSNKYSSCNKEAT